MKQSSIAQIRGSGYRHRSSKETQMLLRRPIVLQNRTAEHSASGIALVTWSRCPWLFQMWSFGRSVFCCLLWLNDASYSKMVRRSK